MEIQLEHEHVLTFCDENKENFSHILLKFFKRDERNRRKVDGDVEVAELDDEQEYAELEDEDYPRCLVCFRIIDDGPVYFCEMCDGMWVHKSCASLPREIRAHPLHLQHDHPLTLLTQQTDELAYSDSPSSFNGKVHICDGCRDIIRIPNYYECPECGLKLDLKCALSPDNDDLQQITASLSPDTKTQISHDSHHHTLFLFNSRSSKKWPFSSYMCKLCERFLLDLRYGCFYCDFYLHKRCVEISQQEREVQHTCPSRHPVSIEYHCEKFICDQCRDLCSGFFMMICKECGFKIDFKCASIRETIIQKSIENELKTQIKYFNHDLHLLSFFNCPNYDINLECEGCRLPLSGPSYGCLECSVYLHKSCAELPRRIQHPFHPSHKLCLRQAFDESKCRACRRFPRGLSYRCCWCPSFCLDIECAINNLGVISALKNKEYHQHELYYFVAPNWYNLKFQCSICSKNCEGSFYICLECNSYFHMECIGIPKEAKHDYHIHPLTLMDPLTEDDIDESKDQYYCYTCENKRNPRYHAYSCQQCAHTGHIFTAHIECVFSTELNELEHNHSIERDDEEDNNHEKFDKLSLNPRCMKQLFIKDEFNDHILNYFEDMIDFSCYLCEESIESVSSYKCSYCQIYLHKECAKLPFKIKCNLHDHPLSIIGGQFLKRFICDRCHVYHEKNMCYHCEDCGFFLDKMCAQGIPSIGNHHRKLNDNGSNVGFSHFSHNHKLRFAFIPKNLKVLCLACSSQISGPSYCCYTCSFFLHESCFEELQPQYIQHPFHIQHPLHFTVKGASCKACKTYSVYGYECVECDFRLDTICVKYLTSSLHHKCHKHILFYFVAEDKCYDDCNDCGKVCDASFYRCLECDLNLHIDCIPIPKSVKSVCHVHPLTLTDTIAEEEVQDGYYCHTCESLRNPKHAAYCCKKCYYTAHIGCVLDEDDGELEIF